MTPENSAAVRKITDKALSDLANALRNVQADYPFLRFQGQIQCYSLDGRLHVGSQTIFDNANGIPSLQAGKAVAPSSGYDPSYQPIIDALKDYVP